MSSDVAVALVQIVALLGIFGGVFGMGYFVGMMLGDLWDRRRIRRIMEGNDE